MLTNDLVRFRKRGAEVVPRYLDAKAKLRLLPTATQIAAIFGESVGKQLAELEAELAEVEFGARDRLVVQGLIKLCEDRVEIASAAELDPSQLRREVFWQAAAAHRGAVHQAPFDRAKVLEQVASRLGRAPADLERELYGDLREAAVVESFRALDGPGLLDRYDLALAQAAMLRAVRITATVGDSDPQRVRRLFRALRFHGLIHQVAEAPGGFSITIDGPYSIFESVKRYGMKLGLALPALVALERYDVRATLRMGPDGSEALMRIGPEDGLVAPAPSGAEDRPEVAALVDAFRALGSAWQVSAAERVVAPPGQPAVIPDLVFSNERTGEEVLLQVFGFWSRASVFNRIEQINRGGLPGLLLAVSKKLRVSEDALLPDQSDRLIVFSSVISAREVLARLDGAAGGQRRDK